MSLFSCGFCLGNDTSKWNPTDLGREVLFTPWTGSAACILLHVGVFSGAAFAFFGCTKNPAPRNQVCRRRVEVGAEEVNWGRVPVGQPGTQRQGCPWVIPEHSRCCHLPGTLAPACAGSAGSCHQGKRHLVRAFFRAAFPAGAAGGKQGVQGGGWGTVILRPGWGCQSLWAQAPCHCSAPSRCPLSRSIPGAPSRCPLFPQHSRGPFLLSLPRAASLAGLSGCFKRRESEDARCTLQSAKTLSEQEHPQHPCPVPRCWNLLCRR